MSFDWQSAVKGVAPFLGGLLGGPLGATAAGAIAQAVLGDGATGDAGRDASALQAALAGGMTPEVRARLIDADRDVRLATMQYADAEKQRELERMRAELADVQSARLRDAEFIRAGKVNERANWMVAMDVFGLVACLAVLTFFHKDIPGEVVGVLSTIAGIFGLCLRDAHQFEFGSSRGSKEAQATIATIAKQG